MRTIIETPFGTFEYVRRFYGTRNWKRSCDLCDLKDSGVCHLVDCDVYDTKKSACHLKRIAKPLNPLKHPKRSAEEGGES